VSIVFCSRPPADARAGRMVSRTGALLGAPPGVQQDAPAPANSAGCQMLVGDMLFHASGPQSCYLSPRVGLDKGAMSPRRSPSPNLAAGVNSSVNAGALIVSPQKGPGYNAALQQVDARLPPIHKVPRPVYDTMAFLYQPPTEPSIAAICRDTFTDMCTQRYETQASVALWRRKQDIEMRQRSRQQAAAWRKACEERERRDTEKLRLQKLKEEQARRREEEEEEARREERKQRWKHVWERVQEKNKVEKPLVEAIMKTAKYSRADHRVQMWRRVQLLKKKAQKKERQIVMRKQNFENLPLHKRKMFEDVFNLYDADHSGRLQASELHECLLELGFRGVDQRERNAVEDLCEQTVKENFQADVDIAQFAAEVVPSVCRALQKLRRSALVDQLTLIDTTEDGRLDFDQLMEVVKDLWPVEVNTDPSNEVQAALTEEMRSHLLCYVREEVDYVQLCQKLGSIFEEVIWNNFTIQQQIRERRGNVDEDTFREFRKEMVHLDRLFERIDIDHSGQLDKNECLRLFKDLGLMPKKTKEKTEVLTLVEAHGNEVDFGRFLKIVRQTRKMVEERTVKVLQRVNPAWAEDENASVNSAQLSTIMSGAIGISLRSRKEQRVVSRVIREADADGDDLYTLHEVAKICCQAQELIRKVKTQEELDVARENGFTEAEMNQVRWAFETLDADESGSLDMREVKKAIYMLQADAMESLSEDKFEVAFKRLDDDHSGSLEFPEFLRLLRLLQDREGVFSGDSRNLTTLSALSRTALLQVLSVFGVDKEASSFGQPELVQRVSRILEIDPSAKLQAASNVTTMQDLLALAVRKHNATLLSSSWKGPGSWH